MFARWFILSYLITSKGIVFAFGLTLSVTTSCHKMRAKVTPTKSINVFAMTIHSEWQFCEEKWFDISMVKIMVLKILGLLSLWFSSLYARGHIPLGACQQPSVTNGHHLLKSPQGLLMEAAKACAADWPHDKDSYVNTRITDIAEFELFSTHYHIVYKLLLGYSFKRIGLANVSCRKNIAFYAFFIYFHTISTSAKSKRYNYNNCICLDTSNRVYWLIPREPPKICIILIKWCHLLLYLWRHTTKNSRHLLFHF